MRPIIGIPLRCIKIENFSSLHLSEKVRRGIIKSGGEVFSITPPQDIVYIETKGNDFPLLTILEKEQIEHQLNLIDGLFISGGKKFSPYDRYLLERAVDKKIPILGVCLGMQIMSCYKRDVKLRDVENHMSDNNNVTLKYAHKVILEKKSKLFDIIGCEEIMVNSFHTKAVYDNEYYEISARDSAGIIEAIEGRGDTFNIGVQWHPEYMIDYDENARKLMSAFIKASMEYRNFKRFNF